MRPRHNGRHFADDLLKLTFLHEHFLMLYRNLLKFVPEGWLKGKYFFFHATYGTVFIRFTQLSHDDCENKCTLS